MKESYIKFSSNENGDLVDFELSGNVVQLMALLCLGYDRIKGFKKMVEESLVLYEENHREVHKRCSELN